MACYHPLTVWRVRSGGVTFKQGEGVGFSFQIACGQCFGCRLERSRQWAVRIMHEAQLHDASCFLTLTYDNDHLPSDGSLRKSDFQKFMKRLRARVGKVRYFHCGEYGDDFNRPHYHVCLFGFDFPDKEFFKQHRGNDIYVSSILADLWHHGFSYIGSLTFESAAYVARYVMKKVTGDAAADHYRRFDSETGEIFYVEPEYVSMSLKPAIGAGWYEKFKDDVFPHDHCVVKGKALIPPRYYFQKLKDSDPDLFEQLKRKRIKQASRHSANRTPERLAVRERVKRAQCSTLKRSNGE